MTRDDVEICARCDRLKTEGYPDKLKQGQGYCLGHQDDSPSHGPFTAWNDRACVLFIRVKDMGCASAGSSGARQNMNSRKST